MLHMESTQTSAIVLFFINMFLTYNIFGIDKVNDDEILKAIKSYLGVEYDGDRVLMNWSLRNILVRPQIL